MQQTFKYNFEVVGYSCRLYTTFASWSAFEPKRVQNGQKYCPEMTSLEREGQAALSNAVCASKMRQTRYNRARGLQYLL